MKSTKTLTMKRFLFPALLTPDKKDGGFVVTFRDLPEAIIQEDSIKEALAEAADCLEEAIAARIDDRLDISYPSQLEGSEYLVAVPIQTALKATLYLAMSNEQCARQGLPKLNSHEHSIQTKKR